MNMYGRKGAHKTVFPISFPRVPQTSSVLTESNKLLIYNIYNRVINYCIKSVNLKSLFNPANVNQTMHKILSGLSLELYTIEKNRNLCP